jgi:hypothetical protein
MNTILVVITLVSLIVAVTMSVVASRLVREERRRSDARVAALATEIHIEEPAQSVIASPAGKSDLPLGQDNAGADLFAPALQVSGRSRLPVFVMLGALIVGGVAAVAVVFSGSGPASAASRSHTEAGSASSAIRAGGAPLELIALGHERDGDGLTVRGVLRNPPAGVQVRQLTATVLLFNHDGGFVGSGRAPVRATTLEPGAETTFVVTVPAVDGVERYRVSFRTDDHVVPHVDARS